LTGATNKQFPAVAANIVSGAITQKVNELRQAAKKLAREKSWNWTDFTDRYFLCRKPLNVVAIIL
jgi:hypothetical protein